MPAPPVNVLAFIQTGTARVLFHVPLGSCLSFLFVTTESPSRIKSGCRIERLTDRGKSLNDWDPGSLAALRPLALAQIDAAVNLARWLLRSRANAEVVAQEALLRACRLFRGFHGGDSSRVRSARRLLPCFFEFPTRPEERGTTIGFAVPGGTSPATTN
jgi:hypothetical protein